MNERKQALVVLEAVGICVIFAALYMIGGSGEFWGGQKWLRRYLAPALFGVWAFFRSGMDWRYLAQMPLGFGALSLPYGADDFIQKVLLRAVFGVANGLAFSVANLINKRFVLVVLQGILVIGSSIGAGVFNPFQNAMVEQFFIGFIVIFIPAMSVGRRSNV